MGLRVILWKRKQLTMAKATIYSIAEKAGLSPATVSKVLNNQGHVSAATIAKVQAIVKETNYKPQQRKQMVQTIGIIIFKVEGKPFCDSFMGELMNGICSEAFRQGRTITFINPAEVVDLSPEEFHCYCLNHGIAGVLLPNIAMQDRFIEKIRQADIPFCVMANIFQEDSIASVGTDNYESTMELLDYVICLGHTQIAFLGLVTDQVESHRERFRAYLDIHKKHNLKVHDELIIDLPDAENTTIRNELIRLMSRPKRPTAIFYCAETLMKVIPILQSMGISTPENVSISGYKMMSDEELLFPDISAIIQPAEEIGSTSVKLLIAKLEHKKVSTVRLKNKIVYGSTVKNLN